MNVEEIQDFCLSLGNDVEEKLPFVMFKNGEGMPRVVKGNIIRRNKTDDARERDYTNHPMG